MIVYLRWWRPERLIVHVKEPLKHTLVVTRKLTSSSANQNIWNSLTNWLAQISRPCFFPSLFFLPERWLTHSCPTFAHFNRRPHRFSLFRSVKAEIARLTEQKRQARFLAFTGLQPREWHKTEIFVITEVNWNCHVLNHCVMWYSVIARLND